MAMRLFSLILVLLCLSACRLSGEDPQIRSNNSACQAMTDFTRWYLNSPHPEPVLISKKSIQLPKSVSGIEFSKVGRLERADIQPNQKLLSRFLSKSLHPAQLSCQSFDDLLALESADYDSNNKTTSSIEIDKTVYITLSDPVVNFENNQAIMAVRQDYGIREFALHVVLLTRSNGGSWKPVGQDVVESCCGVID